MKVLLRNRLKARQGMLLFYGLSFLKIVLNFPVLRRAFRSLMIRLVKQTALFSAEYYLEENPDVAETAVSPLYHYVVYGDKEGRAPMPLFDPAYYRSQISGRLSNVNALLHYAYIGRHFRLSPSVWFDVNFYLENNKDIARSGVDPVLHYLGCGGLEGRSPCEQFDGSYYQRDNPDVAAGGINPLIHYLRYGRYENRQIYPVLMDSEYVVGKTESLHPHFSNQLCWDGLSPRASLDRAVVDIVVPVYKGHFETLNCLHSLLSAATDISYELVVINDASPDVELVEDLQLLAQKGLFTLLTNSSNCGFVQTVNRGMSVHLDRDVLLLNSDTEVYDGWLDRMHQAALKNDLTATVTPLSNNATICSYPRFLYDNPYPLELSYKELDNLVSTVNSGVVVEVPTAVGFCMYIKRACLDVVGLFDVASFGRGYGEENDFCQRAIKKGWRNVVAADVFVRHWGATSFHGAKVKRVQSALKVLDGLHPTYQKQIAVFIADDPLLEFRTRLDWARMQRMCKKTNVLIVNHNRGGGSERHVQEDVQRLIRDDCGVFMLRPKPGQPTQVAFSHSIAKSFPNLPSFVLSDMSGLSHALNSLQISEIHTHSLVDFIPEAPDHLSALIESTGVHWDVNLHDYKVICPRINLVDGSGIYCKEPAESFCNQCLSAHGSDFGVTDIKAWRSMHRRVLLSADVVSVPDQDVADRLNKYFPEIQFDVSPHEEIDLSRVRLNKPSVAANERLRVVVIGAIGKIKGFDVLLACARDALKRKLPIDFILMGYSMNDRLLREAKVTVTGRYLDDRAETTLADQSPHVVWLPSVWPETYSYTLSIAIQCELPVIAFDIGAIARRVREFDLDASTHLLPLEWGSKPEQINDRFVAFRAICAVVKVSNC